MSVHEMHRTTRRQRARIVTLRIAATSSLAGVARSWALWSGEAARGRVETHGVGEHRNRNMAPSRHMRRDEERRSLRQSGRQHSRAKGVECCQARWRAGKPTTRAKVASLKKREHASHWSRCVMHSSEAHAGNSEPWPTCKRNLWGGCACVPCGNKCLDGIGSINNRNLSL